MGVMGLMIIVAWETIKQPDLNEARDDCRCIGRPRPRGEEERGEIVGVDELAGDEWMYTE